MKRYHMNNFASQSPQEKQVCQQDAYLANGGGGQLQLCPTPHHLFKGNVSVTDGMPLSSLFKTIAAANAGGI